VLPLAFWAWLVIAAVLALYELAGAQMLSLAFALGALAAAIAVLLGAGAGWQWGLFFGVSLVGLIGLGRWWSHGR
jgi:membrane protein implicated in regulation of membrane protease activity